MPDRGRGARARLRATLQRHAPALLATISAWRGRRLSERLERGWGCPALTRRIVEAHGPAVLDGPFRGLAFPPAAWHRHLGPKLLGCYERELHPVIERLLATAPGLVVNIGCAEGYYAVGLARRLPGAAVHAFDTDRRARDVTAQSARLNGTPRVAVHGRCTAARLEAILRPGALLVVDCEGGERDLLDPAEVPALGGCDLLVEVHESRSPGVGAVLEARFAGTHRSERIAFAGRGEADAARLAGFSAAERALAVNEIRTDGLEWRVFERRSRAPDEPAGAPGR